MRSLTLVHDFEISTKAWRAGCGDEYCAWASARSLRICSDHRSGAISTTLEINPYAIVVTSILLKKIPISVSIVEVADERYSQPASQCFGKDPGSN